MLRLWFPLCQYLHNADLWRELRDGGEHGSHLSLFDSAVHVGSKFPCLKLAAIIVLWISHSHFMHTCRKRIILRRLPPPAVATIPPNNSSLSLQEIAMHSSDCGRIFLFTGITATAVVWSKLYSVLSSASSFVKGKLPWNAAAPPYIFNECYRQ